MTSSFSMYATTGKALTRHIYSGPLRYKVLSKMDRDEVVKEMKVTLVDRGAQTRNGSFALMELNYCLQEFEGVQAC